MPTTTLDRLIDNPPLFHELPDGRAHSHGLRSHVLQFLAAHLRPGSTTLETGAGLSTVVFALAGCRHTCITPSSAEVSRIRDFCSATDVPLAGVRFQVASSQQLLPRLRDEWDAVLIDGDHSFPAAFVDFYYAAISLRVGGIMVIDDTNLWTSHTLRQYLVGQPEWLLVRRFPRTAIFEKTAPISFDQDWPIQEFVIRKSRLLHLQAKLETLIFLTKQGDFRRIVKKSVAVIRRRSGQVPD